jgi:hypothetical protein
MPSGITTETVVGAGRKVNCSYDTEDVSRP